MEPEQRFKWGLLLIECMKELRGEGLHFLDQEVIPNFDGGPNGLVAWFICEDHDAKERFDSSGCQRSVEEQNAGRGISAGRG